MREGWNERERERGSKQAREGRKGEGEEEGGRRRGMGNLEEVIKETKHAVAYSNNYMDNIPSIIMQQSVMKLPERN